MKRIKLLLNKKVLLTVCIITGFIALILVLNPRPQRTSLSNPLNTQAKPKEAVPSETLKEYTDPSGFTFSYPDNLSLTKKDIEDNSTYADLQLSSKDVNGSLSLKITDSKFSTLEEWLKLNQAAVQTSKEVKLGNLKALEIRTSDRLLLGALDKGVFFSIEVPLIEQNFWMKVYNKTIADFSFTVPDTAVDVAFEGEEVVE